MRILIVLLLVLAACEGDGVPQPNGAACEVGEDCFDGRCIDNLGGTLGVDFPGGICAADCSFDGPECPDEETQLCVRYNPTNDFFCAQKCNVQLDCRVLEGYACVCINSFCTEKVCLPEEEADDAPALTSSSPFEARPD